MEMTENTPTLRDYLSNMSTQNKVDVVKLFEETGRKYDNLVPEDSNDADVQEAIALGNKKKEGIQQATSIVRDSLISDQIKSNDLSLDLTDRDKRISFLTGGSNIIPNLEERKAFLSQIYVESRGKHEEENLNYSADRVSKLFKPYRLQGHEASKLVKDKKLLANTLYGGEFGAKNLGNTEEGDGWKYRGRGLVQLTGRSNYKLYGDMIGVDLVSSPDKAMEPSVSSRIALAFWNKRVRSNVQDFTDVTKITRYLNGGTHGLKERQEVFDTYTKATTE